MTELAKAPASPTARSAPGSLSGRQKALVFLVSIDEPSATKILSQLTQDEMQRLRDTSSGLQQVDPSAIVAVHGEFARLFKGGGPASMVGSDAYLRRLAGKALGEGKAAELWGGQKTSNGTSKSALETLDVPTVLALLEHEQPQTLALILTQIAPERAGELLGQFGVEKQSEIVRRMALLQSVPESVIEEIDRQFASEIATLGQDERREVKGLDAATSLLKRLSPENAQALLEELERSDRATAQVLRKSMFTFEDLLLLDARGMQVLLKEVSTDQLTVALKSATDALKEKVFSNLSTRAAAMLRDELEILGPVRLSDVEAAQQAIIDAAMTLERDGRIQVQREGGGDFV